MAMQGEGTDSGFFKTRLLGGLREMILLDKQGLYFLMSVTKNGSKSHSRGSGCRNIFFLGEEEGKDGEGKRKGFMLAYIVGNHFHMGCESGRVEGGR